MPDAWLIHVLRQTIASCLDQRMKAEIAALLGIRLDVGELESATQLTLTLRAKLKVPHGYGRAVGIKTSLISSVGKRLSADGITESNGEIHHRGDRVFESPSSIFVYRVFEVTSRPSRGIQVSEAISSASLIIKLGRGYQELGSRNLIKIGPTTGAAVRITVCVAAPGDLNARFAKPPDVHPEIRGSKAIRSIQPFYRWHEGFCFRSYVASNMGHYTMDSDREDNRSCCDKAKEWMCGRESGQGMGIMGTLFN
ncbi:hypothetical protein C8R43DRAFT_951894 [Mycena crocata]|nr:hypothetical protein C8R43DRAFT_951894 [Mycena crocata]